MMAWRAITLNPHGASEHPEMTGDNAEHQKYDLNFSNNIEGCLVLSLALQNFENNGP